jgi:protein subunit release factor A
MDLTNKIHEIEHTYNELGELLSDPKVLSDQSLVRKYSKSRSELENIDTNTINDYFGYHYLFPLPIKYQ